MTGIDVDADAKCGEDDDDRGNVQGGRLWGCTYRPTTEDTF